MNLLSRPGRPIQTALPQAATCTFSCQMRIGLQYQYFFQFNGGTTNYDSKGRNANDNNMLLFYTWWSL